MFWFLEIRYSDPTTISVDRPSTCPAAIRQKRFNSVKTLHRHQRPITRPQMKKMNQAVGWKENCGCLAVLLPPLHLLLASRCCSVSILPCGTSTLKDFLNDYTSSSRDSNFETCFSASDSIFFIDVCALSKLNYLLTYLLTSEEQSVDRAFAASVTRTLACSGIYTAISLAIV